MQSDCLHRLRKSLDPIAPPAFTGTEAGISSVLVPLGWHRARQREEILLTKRTLLLENHKGQVSFPGGFREAQDGTLVDTALREAQEEIGTLPSDVEILGALGSVSTHQGVGIFPWVGWMDFPYPFALNPVEVEKVLFLPVATLLEQGLRPLTVQVEQRSVSSFGIEVDGEIIWGATARILNELRQRLINAR